MSMGDVRSVTLVNCFTTLGQFVIEVRGKSDTAVPITKRKTRS